METRKVDVVITDERTGEEIFRKDGFEVPEFWSDRAATIVASKYATDDENSVMEIIGRVAAQITAWGQEQHYFGLNPDDEHYLPEEDVGEDSALHFLASLADILTKQRAAFNSPVWFNCGVKTNTPQMSACYILPVEDDMGSILKYARDIGMIFKWGSGCGTNISRLRAAGEALSNKGTASGPVSFMRVWDAVGDCVKSGGRTRRAASLVCMDVDHPDIMEFIECKAHEERKAKALVAEGFNPEEAYSTVRFQNANHSIRVTDEFMRAATSGDEDTGWALVRRGCGTKTVVGGYATAILRRAAETAWETGDPGIQFHDRMNQDNPVPSMGEIRSTNPCSEFSAVDNSSCNLASLNLVKYWKEGTELDWDAFKKDIKVLITAMDILVEAAEYPTSEIRRTTVSTRPLGLGFTNLGALLMLMGVPYDSEEARKIAGRITYFMSSYAYQQSTALAKTLGSYSAFKGNEKVAADLAHRVTGDDVIPTEILEHGLRNSQLTLLAPTGTISFMMDCDTTGIEPLYAPKVQKTLAGGGTMWVTADCYHKALEIQHGGPVTSDTAPNLTTAQIDIFKTANEIHWKDHILMMAACQKHLNGAISKTINMPADCTIEDVEEAYQFAWEQGLKSIAVYRDGCKDMQPLVAVPENVPEDDEPKWSAVRRKLPRTRQSMTHAFNINGLEGYFTVGLYDDGEPGELFINMQKQGSTINGLMDSFAICLSFALQYGVPLSKLASKFIGTRFEPAGLTDNEDIRLTKSIMDYIFRWLALEFLDEEVDPDPQVELQSIIPAEPEKTVDASGPPCIYCGAITVLAGTCNVCPSCGETTGCG